MNKKSLGQFWTLARLTMLETARQPICLLLTTIAILFIMLLPVLITHSLGELERLVRDSALAVHLMFGLILGCYAACSTLVREIYSGTASTILTKPVGRGLYLTAKYAGVAAFLIVYSTTATLSTLAATRTARVLDEYQPLDGWAFYLIPVSVLVAYLAGGWLNYKRQRPFGSTTMGILFILIMISTLITVLNPSLHFSTSLTLPWALLPVSILVSAAILVLAALAVALAPRLDFVPTVSVCVVVLLLGLVSDYFFAQAAIDGNLWARFAYTVVPNWQHFWVVDGLRNNNIQWDYVVRAIGYGATYSAALLALGNLTFQRMEMK